MGRGSAYFQKPYLGKFWWLCPWPS